MKLTLLLCACAVLISASAARQPGKRFLGIVEQFFHHATEEVAHTVHSVEHAVEGAAKTAVNDLENAAHVVEHAVTGAANEVAHFATDTFNKAKATLGPLLDQAAHTVGPIAKELLNAAVAKLVENAPQLLETLGQAGLESLAQTVLASAGKREVDQLAAVKDLFSKLVQGGVNKTVTEVHKVVEATEQFNAAMKSELETLKQAILNDKEHVQQAVTKFYGVMLAKLRLLVNSGAFKLNLDDLDKVVPASIDLLKQTLQSAVSHQPQKRFLFDGIKDLFGLVEQAQQQLKPLTAELHELAQGLLQPTIDNVKQIAQTLLDNASTVTGTLVQQAMTVLAPFQAQLGPLFQQVQALAASLGLH